MVKNLFDLLDSDAKARSEFDKLPGYIREYLWGRPDEITSYDQLTAYAGRLLRGDG